MGKIIEWGNITWIFFHTIAEKVDEKKFPEIKTKLINIIFGVCRNLPCPICSQDAIKILNKAYLNNIKTKAHFIEFLRQFHNIINIKLSKPTMTRDQIKQIYSNKKMNDVSNTFFSIYHTKSYNPKLLAQSIHRGIYFQVLIKDINSIKQFISQ